jgi:hypothetical protein
VLSIDEFGENGADEFIPSLPCPARDIVEDLDQFGGEFGYYAAHDDISLGDLEVHDTIEAIVHPGERMESFSQAPPRLPALGVLEMQRRRRAFAPIRSG